jgi:hypothetical protein
METVPSSRLGRIPVLRSNFFLPLSNEGITKDEVMTWRDAKRAIKVSFLFATVIVAGVYWFIYRDVALNKAFYTFSTGGRATAQIERVEGFEFSVMSCEGVATALSGDSYTFVFDRILWNRSQLSNGNWTVQCFGACLLVNESEVTEEHISIPVRGAERELSFLSAAQRIRRHCEDEDLAAAASLRGAD